MMIRMSRVLLLCAALFPSCKAEVHCGRKKAADRMEDSMREKLRELTDQSVAQIDCPAVKPGAGVKVSCTASHNGFQFFIDAEFRDDTNFHMETRGVLVSKVLEAKLARPDVSGVDCGPRLHRAAPGDQVECQFMREDVQRTLRVTIKDDQGNLDFQEE